MFTNALIGARVAPAERELTEVLGPSKRTWDLLISELTDACGIDRTEWSSCSPKAGWSLRLKRKSRIIVYLSPGKDKILASFALSDKALLAARNMKLAPKIVKIIAQARRYAEGTAVRIELGDTKDIAAVKALAIAKVNS